MLTLQKIRGIAILRIFCSDIFLESVAQCDVDLVTVVLYGSRRADVGLPSVVDEEGVAVGVNAVGLEVIYWDERLTTVAADRSMMETGIRRENRKEFVDEIAAIFILQGYLDYLSNSRS